MFLQSYTKTIFAFLSLLAACAFSLRLKAKAKDTNGVTLPEVGTDFLYYSQTDAETQLKYELESFRNSQITQGIRSDCPTLNDSIISRIAEKQEYVQIKIEPTSDSTREEESELITYNNTDVQDMIRYQYVGLANTKSLFNDYLAFSPKFNNINELFSVEDELVVTSILIHYYFNDEKNLIDEQSLFISTTAVNGRYSVGSADIVLDTLDICIPTDSNSEFYELVTYQGFINVDDKTSIYTSDKVSLNTIVCLRSEFRNKDVEDNFDVNNPKFAWILSIEKNKMTTDYLLSIIDNTYLDIDLRSYPLEGYSSKYLVLHKNIVNPPKGLGSLTKFSYTNATIFTSKNIFDRVAMNISISDFNFLPLEFTSFQNECQMNYSSNGDISVKINGLVMIDHNLYTSEFIKEINQPDYKITLYGQNNTSLEIKKYHDILIPTMQTSKTNVFPNDKTSVEKLKLFNIDEQSTVIHSPIIKIYFRDYYIYNVIGSINYGGDDEWASISLETVNLDGIGFTYTQFIFPSAQAAKLYSKLFESELDNGDSGFRSLFITDFQLITVNRDLNKNKIHELRRKNIISYASSNVIAKEGITALIKTEFLTDCKSYTFCRLMKRLEVPGNLNFTGLVLSEDTKLEADLNNFKLKDQTYFTNTTLLLKVSKEQNNYSYLKLKGNMQMPTDPETKLNFRTVWRFGNESNSLIHIQGTKRGTYSKVFKNPSITFMENNVEGFIASDASFINSKTGEDNLYYNAIGILGNDCITRDYLVDEINEKDITFDSNINFFESTPIENFNNNIRILNDECKYGSTNFYLTGDLSKNYYNSTYHFENIEDFMRSMFNVNQDDRFSELVRLLQFPSFVFLVYDYKSAKENKPLPFSGDYKYADIECEGQITADIQNNVAQVSLFPRLFSMGGGNLKLYNYEDFKTIYGVDSSNVYKGRFDAHISSNDFKKPNTIFTSVDPTYVIGTAFTLDANVLIFDILYRHRKVIEDNLMVFTVAGRPFRGSFDAEVKISVELIDHLENETKSLSLVTLNKTENFKLVEELTTKLLHEWVSNIIYYDMGISKVEDIIISKQKKLNSDIQNNTYCQIDEICEEIPTLKCYKPSVEAVCVKQKEVCSEVTQNCESYSTECQVYYSNGTCKESVSTCNSWVNTCISDPEVICIEFEENSVPDECITMELSCTRIYKSDVCSDINSLYSTEIKQLNQKLSLVKRWNSIMSELVDNCYCSIDMPEEFKPKNYTTCADKKYYYEENKDSAQFLNFFYLKNVVSDMKLRDITASNTMVFRSDVTLYGDWTKDAEKKDRMIVTQQIYQKQFDEFESREDGNYDLGVESLMYVSHYLDFTSINQTSINIYDGVREIICNEFNLNTISAKIYEVDMILREFGLLNENGSICSIFKQIHNPLYPDEIPYRSDNYEINESLERYQTTIDDTYSMNILRKLTYIYEIDEKNIEESAINQSYQSVRELDDNDFVNLDQRLKASTDYDNRKYLTKEQRDQQVKEQEEQREQEEQQRQDQAHQTNKEQQKMDDWRNDLVEDEQNEVNQDSHESIDELNQKVVSEESISE